MFRKIFKYFAPILVIAGIYTQGPNIETRVFPYLGGAAVHNIVRTDTHVCYTIAYTKLRYGVADYFIILANDAHNNKYDTMTTNMSTGEPLRTLTNEQVLEAGQSLSKTFCTLLPKDKKDLTLSIKVKYYTWHKQWDVYQQLPSVPVPDQ